MSTLLPVLARAAGVGALLGVGGELINSNSKGKWFRASVVASVALRALAFYLGAGAAVGIAVGAIGACVFNRGPNGAYAGLPSIRTIMGAALIGGVLGYLAEPFWATTL
jgi:hypothetical protein